MNHNQSFAEVSASPQPGRGILTTTHVISLRLPSVTDAAFRRSAANAAMSVSAGLDWLLSNSFTNCQLLFGLADCPEALDAKLDVRIPNATFEQLKSTAHQLGMPVSVYIRKLLYHYYTAKTLKYMRSNGHYTLAGCYD